MDKFAHIDEDLRICVFCMNATFMYVCPTCNEYKGLMPFTTETEEYLEIDDLDEYAR